MSVSHLLSLLNYFASFAGPFSGWPSTGECHCPLLLPSCQASRGAVGEPQRQVGAQPLIPPHDPSVAAMAVSGGPAFLQEL